ncbi:MFS transporter [Micromonospora sonneratiae]|uniref:MFS transporter n=1 Tax=Micromonospora sonneratiae TaxID=1184706 RepID=A0ABW3YH74_9ACTN
MLKELAGATAGERIPGTARKRNQGAGRGYLTGLFVDALGSGLYLPLTLLFIHEVTGLSVATVGLGLTVAAVVGLAATPIAGAACDRYGARNVLVASYLVRAVGFASYPLVSEFGAFVAVAAFVAAGDRGFYPANNVYVADLADGVARDRLYALVRTGRNVGFGLGGLFAAGAVHIGDVVGYQLVAAFNGLSFLVAAILLAATGRNRRPARPAPVSGEGDRERTGGGYRRVLTDRPFRRLVLAELAFTVTHSVLPVAMPIYAVLVLDAPAGLLGVLFTVNTLLVAGGQLLVLRWQRTVRRTHAMAFAGLVFIGSFGVFAGSAALPPGVPVSIGLVAGTLLYTLGELLHTAPSASLAAGAAPASHRGRYLAAYQLTWAVSAVVAPVGFTTLITFDALLYWAVLAVAVGAAGVAVVRLAPHLPATAVWPQASDAGAR